MDIKPEEYDGIYFLPDDDIEANEDDMKILYWKHQAKSYRESKPVDKGNSYHIAFFKQGKDGRAVYEDSFEAVLYDPATYISNLHGANCYGCIVRKTEKSEKWFKKYLQGALARTLSFKTLENKWKGLYNE